MKNQINLANCVFAIHAVLAQSRTMSIDKALLIYPLVYQKPMLSKLANKNNSTLSLEKIIIGNPEWFSNFDNIFYNNLALSINAIQYMHEMEHVEIEDGIVMLKKEINYDKQMGAEVKKYYSSSTCISNLLNKPSDYLYLNLRITL